MSSFTWIPLLQLQFGDEPVSTRDFIKALGWGNDKGLKHHDAEDLGRLLIHQIEEKLKVCFAYIKARSAVGPTTLRTPDIQIGGFAHNDFAVIHANKLLITS